MPSLGSVALTPTAVVTRLRVIVDARVRHGWARVHNAVAPVATAAAAAGIAFLIGRHLLGHENPFFAAFAAWACLGFSFDRDLRRVGEIALGVTLGVTMGDLVVRTIGSGWWQIAAVLFVSALLARFVDRGAIFASQAGAQAIVISGVPNLAGGPYGRAIDAIVGGLVALVVAMLIPGDPRRSLRTNLATASAALAGTVSLLATAIRNGDPRLAERALTRARASDSALQEAVDQATSANRQAQLTLNRRYADDLEDAQRRAVLLDQAMRSVRVLARRAMYDVGGVELDDRARIADLLQRFARGGKELAASLRANQDAAAARVTLTGVANELDPSGLTTADPEAHTQLMVLRSAVVDTLEATGISPQAARARLPEG